jgi:hypothetical protein
VDPSVGKPWDSTESHRIHLIEFSRDSRSQVLCTSEHPQAKVLSGDGEVSEGVVKGMSSPKTKDHGVVNADVKTNRWKRKRKRKNTPKMAQTNPRWSMWMETEAGLDLRGNFGLVNWCGLLITATHNGVKRRGREHQGLDGSSTA